MFIGREKELSRLSRLKEDDRSHFVAVYGRRRIGKTYLIREAYKNDFLFQHTGLSRGGMVNQLNAFFRLLGIIRMSSEKETRELDGSI